MAVSIFEKVIQTFFKQTKEGLGINLKLEMDDLALCFDETVGGVLWSFKATGDA
jgi:hypothetical protein